MSSATTAVGRATDKPTLRAVMEETFETQSRARLSQLLSESRKMHRRSISLSYSQGGGLEGLLLACEVAEQVMANLHSFAGPVCTAPVPARLPLVGVEGAESGAEWERVKEEFTKNETRQKNEAKAEEEQKMSGEEGERAPHARRHTRSLSDSGMVVVLQMANANQRAADRRRAQWEKKKKAQEQVLEKQLNMDEETRLAEERRREEERRERERKEQEALVARNERLLRLFVREDVAKPARDGAATEMLRQKSESERVLTINERKRSEESGDKTPRERRQQQQQQRDVESTAESGAEDEYLRTLRSGSDIESAEEVHLGIEEWERHDEEEEDEGELWGEEATTKDGEKKKMKLMRLKKIKPKIISGRKRSRRDSRDNSKEKDKKKSGPKQLLLLQSSPN